LIPCVTPDAQYWGAISVPVLVGGNLVDLEWLAFARTKEARPPSAVTGSWGAM